MTKQEKQIARLIRQEREIDKTMLALILVTALGAPFTLLLTILLELILLTK